VPLLDALFRLLGLRRLLILADWFIVGAFPGALTAILAPTLPHLLRLLSPADVPYVGFLLFPSTLILSSALQNLPIAFSTWAVTALLLAMAFDAWLFWHNWGAHVRAWLFGDAAVIATVRRAFPPEEREEVLGLLGRYQSSHGQSSAAFTRLFILKLSDGRLAEVRRLVDFAREDVRDFFAHFSSSARGWLTYL